MSFIQQFIPSMPPVAREHTSHAQASRRSHEADFSYLCIDLKTFFASVECAARGLDPFTTNLVVADPSRGEGTICLAITPAMKALGIKNRCRVYEIPKDVSYQMVRPRMQAYIDASRRIQAIYEEFCAPMDVFAYSIDECFIYITPYLKRYHCTPEAFAQMLIDAVFAREHICATAGIGTNMFLAKIAMDIIAKHNNSHLGILTEESFCQELWHKRPLSMIWGIGHATQERLARYGVFDLYGITTLPEKLLYKEFGVNASQLINHAWGKDYTTIAEIKAYRPKNTSISNGQVLQQDYSATDAKIVLKEMIYESCLRLIRLGELCRRVELTIGYAGKHMHLPAQKTCSKTLTHYTSSRKIIEEALLQLWDTHIQSDLCVRRISITLAQLGRDDEIMPVLFDGAKEAIAERSLAKTTLAVKDKFGKNALIRGTSLLPCATGRARNAQIGGHHA